MPLTHRTWLLNDAATSDRRMRGCEGKSASRNVRRGADRNSESCAAETKEAALSCDEEDEDVTGRE